jgi:NADPH:quinone reductase-like Zn-dependent oxidoreductase
MGASDLPRNISALATDGRLVVLGMQGGVKGELNLGALLTKRATVHAAGLRSRSAQQKATIVSETQNAIWPMLEAGTVRPIVDSVLPLDQAARAHQLMDESGHIGKILLRT